MNKMHDEIKKLIDIAWEIAQHAPEEIRSKTYEITYSNLLNKNVPLTQTNVIHEIPISEIPVLENSFDDKLLYMAQQCKLNMTKLRDVFYIDDDLIYLIVSLHGSQAEQQSYTTQCILTAYSLLFKKEWVDSVTLMKCLNLSGIKGTDHYARNMRKNKNLRIRGKGKGSVLEYKISDVGKIDTYEIIYNLAKGEQND